MSQQQVDPFFIERLRAVLSHWQQETEEPDQAKLAQLDGNRQHLFQIVNLGLEHSDTRTAAAHLSLAIFPLVEQHGYWLEWIPVLEQAIESHETGDSSLLFQLHNRLGQLYRWNRLIDKAVEAHLAAEAIAKQLSDDHALANAWFNLSEDYNQNRRSDESEKYGLLALETFNRLQVNEKWTAAVYNSLGTSALYAGRLETAEERLRQTVALLRPLDDSIDLARALINLANVLREAKNFEDALDHFLEAARILDESAWIHDQALVQISLGGLYNDLNQLTNSETAYRRALSQPLNELGYSYYQAYALQGLGNVLFRMARYEEAKPILKNAIELWQTLNVDLYRANSLGTLAETVAAQNDLDQAVALYEQAIVLAQKHQDDPFGQTLLRELTEQLAAIHTN